jgi:hypothetical protein
VGLARAAGYDGGMTNESRRIAFAGFLRRLAAGRLEAFEWNRFAVQHYHDPELEQIRCSVVRLCIEKRGAVQWSDSEIAALQHWSRTLRRGIGNEDSHG